MPKVLRLLTKRILFCVAFMLTAQTAPESQTFSAAQQDIWKEELKYWNLRTAGTSGDTENRPSVDT